jgi:RNA polymerase sigma-70 factor (ECF subfamily)
MHRHSEKSDLELFLSLQQGNQEALGSLMARYERLVFSVAVGKLRDPGEAEDMVQTVFLELYRLRANFDPKLGTVKTWLLQLTYSRSLDRFHYLSRRMFFQTLELDDAVDAVWCGRCLVTLVECRERIEAALKALNDAQREVILRAHFEGRSMKEIAQESGETLGAVRHHFYRGLKKMRLCLEAQG